MGPPEPLEMSLGYDEKARAGGDGCLLYLLALALDLLRIPIALV
jgi:hypothetical protein